MSFSLWSVPRLSNTSLPGQVYQSEWQKWFLLPCFCWVLGPISWLLRRSRYCLWRWQFHHSSRTQLLKIVRFWSPCWGTTASGVRSLSCASPRLFPRLECCFSQRFSSAVMIACKGIPKLLYLYLKLSDAYIFKNCSRDLLQRSLFPTQTRDRRKLTYLQVFCICWSFWWSYEYYWISKN